jgi:DGQHR domain-containing protein
MKIPCIRINQNGKDMYLLGIKARDLFEQFNMKADIQTKENVKGYQRKPSQPRANAYLRYLDKEKGISPTSILLNYRGNLLFQPLQDNFGFVEIPNKSDLWEVDGQHRSLGLKKGIEIGNDKIRNFDVPVVLMM